MSYKAENYRNYISKKVVNTERVNKMIELSRENEETAMPHEKILIVYDAVLGARLK